jgi:hypothetical protein
MTQAGQGDKRERENDDGGDGQPPLKDRRLNDAADDDADGQPVPPPPPPPPPAPPPPPPTCSICLLDLTGVPFAQDPNQGTISLVCQQGQVPHEFHGDCLQDWAYKSCFNPDQVGQVVAGVNFWYRLPPRCPNCRARFVAATYWPAYAAADNYPLDGIQYTTQVADDTSDSEDSENSDSENSDSGEEDGQQQDEYSSDEDAPYEVTIVCDTCGVHGPHDEMTADALIDNFGDGHGCTRCPTPIQRGDDQAVLRCRACGATSHYHD